VAQETQTEALVARGQREMSLERQHNRVRRIRRRTELKRARSLPEDVFGSSQWRISVKSRSVD
jgi:hypothetical protein